MTIPLADVVYAVVLFFIILTVRFLSTDMEKRNVVKIILHSIVILIFFLLSSKFYEFIQNKTGKLGSIIVFLVFAGLFAWYCYYQYRVLLNAQKKLDRKYKVELSKMKHDFK